MDPDVQAFKDAMEKKAAAKEKVMVAVGEGDWATVAKEGISGTEGKAMAEAQSIADNYVKNHPEEFAAAKSHVTPDGLGKIVTMIDLFRQAGMEEAALKMTMFELSSFERQTIGATPRATVRLGNGG